MPEVSSGVFYKDARKQPAALPATPPSAPPDPPPQPVPAPQVAIPSMEQLGGMLNGLNGMMGNLFENDNWWLWAAALIIFLNPELRKKLFGKGKEAD